jgi:tetratricopeptide (TPR) repeat protein
MLRNKRFVGREDTITELRRKLFASHDEQNVSLVGLGGVGKTQVAFQVAYWVKEHRPDHSIFWVSATSSAGFYQGYTDLATKLGIREREQQKDLCRSLKDFLESEEVGPWLLIVDNADDMSVLFGSEGNNDGIWQHLPRSESGRALITTRSEEVAMTVSHEFVRLREMKEHEAEALLEKCVVWKEILGDVDRVSSLLRSMAFLPLAIIQTAAYLNRNRISIAQYLNLLDGSEMEVAKLMGEGFQDTSQPGGERRAVASTWLTSFAQIKRLDGPAADLLVFLALIEPKAIPRSMLPRFTSEAALVQAIGTLTTYAFIARRGTTRIYDMHNLVQLATKLWVQGAGNAVQAEEHAVRHLTNIFPLNDYSQQERWRAYMPHALGLLGRCEIIDLEQRYLLCLRVGCCLQADGRATEAVKYHQECYTWRKEHFTEHHPQILLAQHWLARAYGASGQMQNAVVLLEDVVQAQEKSLPPDSRNRLASQHELAGAYQIVGRVQEAVVLLEDVVRLSKQATATSEADPDLLASQHGLALAYLLDGKVKEAMELMKEVVRIQTQSLPRDHPERLGSKHTLARVYQADGQAGEATTMFKEVVQIREEILAKDHPSRLYSEHCLAISFWELGERKRAHLLMAHVVKKYRESYDKGYPSRKASEWWLGHFEEIMDDEAGSI